MGDPLVAVVGTAEVLVLGYAIYGLVRVVVWVVQRVHR